MLKNPQKKKRVFLTTTVIIVILCVLVFGHFTPSQEERRTRARNQVLPNRLDLTSLLNAFGYRTMIEIGVEDGDFARAVLSKWPGFEHYYGVDPYETQKNYVDTSNRDQARFDNAFKQVLSTLNARFGSRRITMIKDYSTRAVSKFETESIDFIYVDARHDYCGVTDDLNAFYPVLKCGGLFAGHDYELRHHGTQDWGLCGNGSRIEGSVKRAVAEFAARHAIPLVQATREAQYPSWYFFKNC
jgi:hypothetical protein